MTRDEYLRRCKDRALEYVDKGQYADAVASMGSDLSKHQEFDLKASPMLMLLGIRWAMDGDEPNVRYWIEGFR